MKLTEDYILQKELDAIATSKMIPWESFRDKTFFITGATGLIGGQTILALLNAGYENNLNIKVYALVRNREKAEKLFKYALNQKLTLVVQDITEPVCIPDDIDYIIHGASMTGSKDFVDYPVETIKIALEGTENVLKLAKEKKISAMVYLSSLEVYGVADFSIEKVAESTFGSIDPMSVRSSYSEGKRMAECLCASYASEYCVPVKTVRLCQTFGAGVEYADNRVFAQFARSIIEGKDIVLRTDGSTERNYCSVSDAISGILTVLDRGEVGEAYNVANKDTLISIKEMAELLIKKYPESGTSLVFDVVEDAAKLGYNPKVKMNLDTAKIEMLGWKAQMGLEDMFDRLIESMKQRR